MIFIISIFVFLNTNLTTGNIYPYITHKCIGASYYGLIILKAGQNEATSYIISRFLHIPHTICNNVP
jgi:hypothetical protein